MLGAGYALLCDGHVRVDVFYRTLRPSEPRRWSTWPVARSCMLPVCALVLWSVMGLRARVLELGERSGEALGLPFTLPTRP